MRLTSLSGIWSDVNSQKCWINTCSLTAITRLPWLWKDAKRNIFFPLWHDVNAIILNAYLHILQYEIMLLFLVWGRGGGSGELSATRTLQTKCSKFVLNINNTSIILLGRDGTGRWVMTGCNATIKKKKNTLNLWHMRNDSCNLGKERCFGALQDLWPKSCLNGECILTCGWDNVTKCLL